MRRTLASALVGLAAVLLVAGMVAVWANHLLLSPSHWEKTSTALLANPTIRTSTANYLTDQLDARLDLSRLLSSGLGSTLGPLARSSVAAVRAAVFHAIDTALGLSPVRRLWAHANRGAATAVVRIVDRRGPITAAGSAVTINLGAVLHSAATDAHLPASVTAALPTDAGRLTVVRSDQVHTVRAAGRTVRDLARWLVIVIPVLWLLALALASGRRLTTLAWIGITAAVAAALVLVARALLATPLADAISADPSQRHIIAAALPIITASLGHIALIVGVVGLFVGAVAGLAGLLGAPAKPTRYARS